MKFETINNFVVNHTGAQFFEADLRLYKKYFPNSKLIPELEKAPEYARKSLDERMVYELLSGENACIDCIVENRGFVRNQAEEIIPLKPVVKTIDPVIQEPVIIQAYINTETAKYNQLKQFVFENDLAGKCPDNKAETYRRVIADFQFNSDNSKKKEAQG